jgi:glycosyltransferase involved in cell wall biosynthesis
MGKIEAIHQISYSVGKDDGVSNSIFYIQKLLKSLGYKSNIYVLAKNINKDVKQNIFSFDEYEENKNTLIVFHFSLGIFKNLFQEINSIKQNKILYFHNITPSHFFHAEKFKERCEVGRVQLRNNISNFIGAFTNSKYSKKELIYHGYKKVYSLPTLVDFDRFKNKQYDKTILEQYKNSFNILFVGRVIQHKAQHQLINLFYQLKLNGIKNIKLFIVGGNFYSDYYKYMFNYRDSLGLENDIIISGKVENDELNSYYKVSNLYISMSEHEGFGMPMIEAIYSNTPVLAYNTTAIPYAIGKDGLFEFKNAESLALFVQQYIISKDKRDSLLNKQKKLIKKYYDSNSLIKKLEMYLQEMIKVENE